MLSLVLALASAFTWHDADGRIELRENGQPVLAYNHETQLRNGAPADRKRSGYVHPVWAPNGAVVTDDFPRDHWHHRGIFWAWPVVRYAGKTHDPWTLRGGMESRPLEILEKTGGATGVLRARNGWYAGDKHVLTETVKITAKPAQGNTRTLLFDIVFEAVEPLELAGSPDAKKGYGGFSVRFGPRTGTVIRTEKGVEAKDTDMVPHPWAEMQATFGGRQARLRVEQDPGNPGYPSGWCIRNYGFLGVNYPGLEPLRLERGKPLRLSYTVTVASVE